MRKNIKRTIRKIKIHGAIIHRANILIESIKQQHYGKVQDEAIK